MIKLNKKLPLIKYSLYALAAAAFLTLVILTVVAFKLPVTVTNTATTNSIEQTYHISYQVEVMPCTLYPEGGMIEPEGALMRNIVQSFLFDVHSSVTADNAVQVKGAARMNAVLVADKYWERDFPLSVARHIESNGEQNELINGSYRLDAEKLFAFIDQVTEETESQPDKYLLMIQPELSGMVSDEGLSMELAQVPPLIFKISGKEITHVSEAGDNVSIEEALKPFSLVTPVTSSQTVPQYFRLLGLNIPVSTARAIFGVPALALAGFGVVMLNRIFTVWTKTIPEAQKIEKKYGKRIFSLNAQVGNIGGPTLALHSFGDLLRLSSERELPIFKTSGDGDHTYFLVIDAHNVYSFAAQGTVREPEKYEIPAIYSESRS